MSQPTSLVKGYSTVTAQILEDRISMYISAVDKATAMNNGHQSSQLQQDIQKLVDLMERVSAGQLVTEEEVPPPLAITPQTDVLANPLGELSSRLAEYHKALYFAEEELSEDRMNKIQRLQRGLQTIHELQKRTQAGFPVRADEIPPPVAIPSDDEFDVDAVSTLESRLAHYNAVLLFVNQAEGERRRVPKIQSAIRTIEFLLTRARAKRPIWKKDIPPEFEYGLVPAAQSKGQPVNKVKLTLQLRSLQKRVANITFKEEHHQKHLDTLKRKLQEFEADLQKTQISPELEDRLAALAKLIENVEKKAFAEKTKDLDRRQEDLDLIETRLTEYKTAVLASKRDGLVKEAIKHFKVLKGLQALKEALEQGEAVDMTLVPPPPRDFTPTGESLPSYQDLDQTMAATDVPQNSSGATAHLSPVFIKPAVETAEDKLAKKLFSYLDKGADSDLPISKQMLNINNITAAPVQYLPKVENTDTCKDGSVASPTRNVGRADQVASAGSNVARADQVASAVSNVARADQVASAGSNVARADQVASAGTNVARADQVASVSDTTTGSMEDGSEEVEAERSFLGYEESFQSFDSQTEAQDQHFISQIADRNPDPMARGNELEEENMNNQMNEMVASHKDAATPPLSKSSDIYLRKTLDSVGFLSCQKVPGHLTYFNTISGSNNSKVIDHIPSESDTEEQQSTEVNLEPVDQKKSEASVDHNIESLNLNYETHTASTFSSHPVDLPSHDVSSWNQPGEAAGQGTIAVTASSQINNVQSTEFPEKQPDSSTVFESTQNTNNDRNNSASSYETLPKQSVDMDTGNLEITHSDYSDTSMPKVLADVSHNTNLQHSSCDSFIPDIVRSDLPLATDIDASRSARNIGQQVATDGDDLETDQALSLTFTRRDAPVSESAGANQDRNGKSSPDTLEFLDLMDSMAMPAAAEPASFPYLISSDVASSSDQQTEPVLSNQKPDVFKETITSAEVLAHRNVNETPQCQAFSENNQSSHAAFISSGTSLSVDQANNVVGDQQKLNSSYSSNGITESNHLSQNQENKSFSISSSHEDLGHSAVLFNNYTTVPGSSGHNQTPHNGSNENPSAPAALFGHNFIRAVGSHSQSKSQSASSARSSNDFSYSDVAFTCLENLKYDCLLSLAKGTEESLLEEKKLKVKFEQIKNKLRNGGKRTWEVYKACVEREHASLIQQIEDLRLLQQWSDVQLLSEKRNIAERELAILKSRVPALKY